MTKLVDRLRKTGLFSSWKLKPARIQQFKADLDLLRVAFVPVR